MNNTNKLTSRFCVQPGSLAAAAALGLGVGLATHNLAVGIAVAVIFAVVFRRRSSRGNTLPSNS